VSADWPRGLTTLIIFLVVVIMFVRGVIENHRNPNSKGLKRATIYFAVLYVVFLIVARFSND